MSLDALCCAFGAAGVSRALSRLGQASARPVGPLASLRALHVQSATVRNVVDATGFRRPVSLLLQPNKGMPQLRAFSTGQISTVEVI